MGEHISKRHNKSLLLYHIVCTVKYRRIVFQEGVENSLKSICEGIEERYEIFFIEIGADDNHVHFLIQSVPMYSAKKIVQMLKSITAKEIFRLHPEVKQKLWGGQFWTDGYYVSTVGLYANEAVIKEYVKRQGEEKNYKKIHNSQLRLF
jgi:REP element-mobilizing transposase RayT